MKKKNGFISMTLVYTFLVLFMFLMLAILRTYIEKDKFLQTINEQIDNDIGIAKGSRVTVINRLIEDNMPVSDEDIKYHKISNSYYGNGNGLFYMDKRDFDEYYDIKGSSRTYNIGKITDENNDGYTNRIYYFRGNVDNNHIIFAGKCFRIMRTNEDGSIRIRYNGNPTLGKCPTIDLYESNPNLATIAQVNYNPSTNNTSEYVNIVSGSVPNADSSNEQSPIVDILNQWYSDSFIPSDGNAKNYTEYISKSTVFCNNKLPYEETTFYKSKEISPTLINSNNHNLNNDKNIKSIITLKCENKNDRFSILDNTLLYPIGLVTAQDVALAGGYLSVDGDIYDGGPNGATINTDYYMYTNSNYWTMSPFDSTSVIYVNNEGLMQASPVFRSYGVIPVISLNANIVIANGDGRSSNPYIVK